MNTIKINGMTIAAGRNISIHNNRVFVDGKDVTPDAKEIKIEVSGDIDRLEADACNTIAVGGNAGNVSTQSGDVDVAGYISGSVQTMSGNVECGGSIAGNCSTMSGDIRSRR